MTGRFVAAKRRVVVIWTKILKNFDICDEIPKRRDTWTMRPSVSSFSWKKKQFEIIRFLLLGKKKTGVEAKSSTTQNRNYIQPPWPSSTDRATGPFQFINVAIFLLPLGGAGENKSKLRVSPGKSSAILFFYDVVLSSSSSEPK